jgi:hypothetical protein
MDSRKVDKLASGNFFQTWRPKAQQATALSDPVEAAYHQPQMPVMSGGQLLPDPPSRSYCSPRRVVLRSANSPAPRPFSVTGGFARQSPAPPPSPVGRSQALKNPSVTHRAAPAPAPAPAPALAGEPGADRIAAGWRTRRRRRQLVLRLAVNFARI